MLLLLATGSALGQAGRPRVPGQPPAGAAPRAPRNGEVRGFPAKPVIEADLAAVEDELAQYIQFRGDVGPGEAARLELLIDLRILARWCLSAAAAAQPESDLQVAGYLRGQEALAASRSLTEHFKSAAPPTAAQTAAMTKIHGLTFNLAELRQPRQADDVLREVGAELVVAAGPLPPDVKQVPLMRPAARPGPGPGPKTTPAAEIDPVSRANLLSVTPALKKQAVALATASNAARADAAGPDAKKRDEAQSLIATTSRILDMAEGMSQNAALDPQSRPKLEQQLADGVALYSDPRTRTSGKQRISALDDYARTLVRVRKLGLKPEIQQRLAPAFTWAAEHPEGPKLLSAVEAYLAACARMDSRSAAPATAGIGPRETKAIGDAMKACTTEREAFLTDATAIGRSANADPAAFSRRVEAMARALDSAELYEKVPAAQQKLLAFKPKPTGGLERRVGAAFLSLSDPKATSRDEASRLLAEVVKLADQATAIETLSPIGADVVKVYTRGKLTSFDAKRRDVIAELVNLLASGKDPDTLRVQRLDQMRALRAALNDATALEAALRRAEALARWTDWPVEPADYQAIFTPYRETMGSLFEAYATADAPPTQQWGPIEARYAPAIRLLVQASSYADTCAAFPAGWPGNAGRLQTPLDVQPFALERYGAFCLKLWSRYESSGDSKSAAAVAEALAARVKGQR